MTDRVAVVVRTFNRADRIRRAIDSIFAQTCENLRVIVIDDGSTDGTKALLGGDARLEYHWQENQGTWGAMVAGLKLADEQLVAFLDSDDEWDRDYLERSVELLHQHDAGFVFTNYRNRTADRELRGLFEGTPLVREYMARLSGATHRFLDADETRRLFVRYIPAPTSAIVARRELINPVWKGRTFAPAEDWNIILRMIFDRRVTSVMESAPRWTKWVHGGNIADGKETSADYCRMQEDSRAFMLLNYGEQMTGDERAFIAEELATLNFDCAYHLAVEGRLGESLRHYARSFRHRPSARVLVAAAKSIARSALPRPAAAR